MNWWEVWTNVLAALEAEPDIAEVLENDDYESTIYLDGERAFEVPSMTVLLVVNLEEEVFAPADWQFDLYTRTMDELLQVERAMMRLLNQPLPVTLDGAELTAEFTAGAGGTLLRGPERDSYYHRRLEFTFTPVRSRYYRPQPAGGS